MRWWVAALVLATGCGGVPRDGALTPSAPTAPAEPMAAGFAALAAYRYDEAARRFEEARGRYPALADCALYFEGRAAARGGHRDRAQRANERVLGEHPGSVWIGPASLAAGELALAEGESEAATQRLGEARERLARGGTGWARATLALAATALEDGNPSQALALSTELRQSRPRSLAARRGRRLADRTRRLHPGLPPPDHLEEAELRLREGDAPRARIHAERALAGPLPGALRPRALWALAQARRGTGDPAAEDTCLEIERDAPTDPLAPRALGAAAGWRWNSDDDEGARRLFGEVLARFPASPQAPEALYAIGRIDQEAGRYDEAFDSYSRLADGYPGAPLAAEARWRAGWVRYLANEFVIAERWFAGIAADAGEGPQAAASYWRARALERLGREDEARVRLEQLLDHHPASYYAGLAEERLGRDPGPGEAPPPGEPRELPAGLTGPHAERARLLSGLGFSRLARREVEALEAEGAPRDLLIEAYRAVGAPAAVIRLARTAEGGGTGSPRRDLYPLGYWPTVRAVARSRGVDPLLVTALIRQESLFDPEAVSVADARGLMQLLPRTAEEITRSAGAPPPESGALHDTATNIDLGTALLARLLARYGGSEVKALAAYNAGEDAVTKWERRYGGREPDEFVELISYRETRDYVKTVLRNYRLYRRLYGEPSAAATSPGSPPNAPFDMMTMTSPGRTEESR